MALNLEEMGPQNAEQAIGIYKRIKGFDQLKRVVNNVRFQDGIQADDQSDRNAA
ncbi:MAG: hypothetical protein U9Q35_03410 [Pseudomonadota bacterium]|nr:hypothetical protein [Pseudomonadota bacterium]